MASLYSFSTMNHVSSFLIKTKNKKPKKTFATFVILKFKKKTLVPYYE
jgi:hypothetical protein